MKITVAIPSYNKEKYIERCIRSVLAEKEHIDKIILVDNNSTDNTFLIAQKYEPSISCYKNESNIGMAPNWNKCIELCNTEWLMILHADDELLPGAILRYKELLNKYPSIGLFHANSYSVTEGDYRTKFFTPSMQRDFWTNGAEAMKCNYGVCSAVMVKMDAYKQLGNFIISLSSDAEMWSRIASKFDVGFIQEPTVIYHVSKTSTGYESHIYRTIFEIKKDWDFLHRTIMNHYPTKEEQALYWKKYTSSLPGSYYAVAKANLKVKHYRKALESILVIFFYCRAPRALYKMIINDIKKLYLTK